MEIPEVEVYGLTDKLWSGELYMLFEHDYVLFCVDVEFFFLVHGELKGKAFRLVPSVPNLQP